MDFQKIIVGLIILVAGLYLGKMIFAKVKTFSPKSKNCGNNCGCNSKTNKITV